MQFSVRRATPDDAASISRILGLVVAERRFTAIQEPWPEPEQHRYLESLSPRETFHVAETSGPSGEVIGYQSLDLYSTILNSMAHVGQVGTFLHPQWRGKGVGGALFEATLAFAAAHGYRKFVIQVRGGNMGAQAFYGRLGFRECGRLSRQVIVDGCEEDEVLMEYFVG
jgi:RimJ/RimL family protein N-acetyltransferase